MNKKRMPPTRKGRIGLIKRNSMDYVRRMGTTEFDKLLVALAKTKGLTTKEISELVREREGVIYNVESRFVPEHIRRGEA